MNIAVFGSFFQSWNPAGFPNFRTFEGCLPHYLTLEGAQSPVTNLDTWILMTISRLWFYSFQ